MEFVKAHGTGNDFVLLADPDDAWSLTAGFVHALCDRHRGLGADGVIRIAPPRRGVDADVFMDYRNADGTVAEMCGNGVRCVAKYVADRVGGDAVAVDTRAGVKPVVVTDRHADHRVARLRVDMGAPQGVASETVRLDGTPTEVTTVSMGNPHAVVHAEPAAAPLAAWAAQLTGSPLFPHGVNVEVITVTGRDAIAGRIYERGVGETLASGSGASAMAVAAHHRGLTGPVVEVTLPGGRLEVDWGPATLTVTGPAEEVASGVLDNGWLARLPGGAAGQDAPTGAGDAA